jgi:hypothetical protein
MMASVDVCRAKTLEFRKRMKLKMNDFFIIFVDDGRPGAIDQRCYLQNGLNNLFDAVTFFSNREWYLFDARHFR